MEWRERFDDYNATNLETWTSDHCPVLMEVYEKGSGLTYLKKSAKRVHHEDMWSSYEACKEIVQRELSWYGNWKYANPVRS